MALPNAETLRSLTPSIVLLALVLALGYAWIRDRNLRIRDKDEQIGALREAHRISELARDRQGETVRGMLEAAATSNALLTGIRTAVDQLLRERDS